MFSRRSLFTALALSISSLGVATTALAAAPARPKKKSVKHAPIKHAKARARPAKPVSQG
jgi:hypothetical protein